jgi:acetylornithine deacetylase/succinyl-diaminopimelate desuccinylase-like protein
MRTGAWPDRVAFCYRLRMTRSRTTALLADLVAIPSVNPMGRGDIDPAILGEARYAEHVRDHLARHGVDAALVGTGTRKSVIATITARDPIDTVLVASHLDTVPIDGMVIAPFDPAIANGRMQGRGSCDTKAGMAALLAALERVLAQGTLRRNVIVIGEADEEMASVGVRDVLAALQPGAADWVLATEPTDLKLVTRHKGRITLELLAEGRACHASEPDLGRNAVVAMARATLALTDPHERLRAAVDTFGLGPSTLSVSMVNGGKAPNIVPDRACLVVDRRILPNETVQSVREQIEDVLRRAGVADEVRVSSCSLDKDALETSDDQPAVRHCQAALASRALGTSTTSAPFGTDAGPFSTAGLPGVVLGPGQIQQAHTADEWIDLAQVDAMTEIFVALLQGDAPRS